MKARRDGNEQPREKEAERNPQKREQALTKFDRQEGPLRGEEEVTGKAERY